ncbi:hypothetical protein LOZ65_002477 [Ophidiomyces ophidiicola]|nr:hypothetical protein LOZ65_002477 [Ophidiomyces ophidiicola]
MHTADALGIRLNSSLQTITFANQPSKPFFRQRNHFSEWNSISSKQPGSFPELTEPAEPFSGQLETSSDNIPMSPPLTPSQNQHNSKPLGLLFRYWSSKTNGLNSVSCFVAGLWSEQPQSIPSPNYDMRVIHSMARTHLSRYPIDSPFISFFDTPLSPLQRALHEDDGMLTVVDISSFDQSRIFSAVNILKDKPLSSEVTTRGYAGYSEFLIWGDVSSQYIICSVRANDLLKLKTSTVDFLSICDVKSFDYTSGALKAQLKKKQIPLDKKTGMFLGKFLRRAKFPQQHVNALAVKIACSWRFIPVSDDDHDRYSSFLEGVQAAYKRPRVPQSTSNAYQVPKAPSVPAFSAPSTPVKPRKSSPPKQKSVDKREWVIIDSDSDSSWGSGEDDWSGVTENEVSLEENDLFAINRARVRAFMAS